MNTDRPELRFELKEGQRHLTRKQRDARDHLYPFAVANPEGFTYEDVDAAFGWERTYFFGVVRALRLALGDNDAINLVCDPRGPQETWLYRLVGSLDEGGKWAENRIDDMHARLETVCGVAESLARTPGGSEKERRKARKVARSLGYLLEELEDIEVNSR